MSDDKSHIRNTQQPYNKVKYKQPNHVNPEKFKKIVEVKMSDQDSRIKNNQQPYNQERPKEPEQVDPEKFKKIMEVQETDDSQKQHKRPIKEEELDDEEEVTDSSLQNPEDGRFASLMNPEATSSMFDISGDGIQYMNDDGEGPRTNMDDDDVDLMAEPPPAQQSQNQPPLTASNLDATDNISSESSSAGFQTSGPLPAMEESSPNLGDMLSDEAGMITPQTQPQEQSASSDQNSSSAPPPSTNNMDGPTGQQSGSSSQNSGQDSSSKSAKAGAKKKASKKRKSVKKTDKKVITKTVSKEAKVAKSAAKKVVKTEDKKVEPAKPKKPSAFTPFDPQKVNNVEGMPNTEGHTGGGSGGDAGSDQKDRDERHDDTMGPVHREPSIDAVGITNDFASTEVHSPAETSALPAVSHLTPQMYELFEQMAGVIMIQHSSGQTTTTVTINMKGSIFDGSEVVFNQYKTAPQSYNLELKGSPEAVQMFTENIPLLDACFKEGGFKFDVNILTPSLSKKSSSKRVKRKSGSEDKKDKK